MVRGKKKSSVHEYEGFFFNGEKVAEEISKIRIKVLKT